MLDQRGRGVDDGGVDLCGRVNVGAHMLVVRLKGSLGWLRRRLRRRVKYEGEEEEEKGEEVEGSHEHFGAFGNDQTGDCSIAGLRSFQSSRRQSPDGFDFGKLERVARTQPRTENDRES
jgi:hypothetical protein